MELSRNGSFIRRIVPFYGARIVTRVAKRAREREREREREKGEKDGKDSLPPLLFLTKSTVDFFDKLHSRPAVPAFV